MPLYRKSVVIESVIGDMINPLADETGGQVPVSDKMEYVISW